MVKQPRALAMFLVVSFAWSWACWIPLIVTGQQVTAGSFPTHLHGLVGPAIGGLAAAAFEGKGASRTLVRSLFPVGIPFWGWMLSLSPLAFIFVGSLVESWPGGESSLSALSVFTGLPDLGLPIVFAVVLVLNGFGEEIGWRGYLLPRLQSRFGPWRGTITLWLIWSFWHVPLFWLVVSFAEMDPFVIAFGWLPGLLAGSIVLANVMHVCGGKVVGPVLWHTLYNFSAATGISALSPAIGTVVVMAWAIILVVLRGVRPQSHLISVGPASSVGVRPS